MSLPEQSSEYRDLIETNLLSSMPLLQEFAQRWLDHRPTLKYRLRPSYVRDLDRETDYKYHFLIAYEYLSMAKGESQELTRAFTKGRSYALSPQLV